MMVASWTLKAKRKSSWSALVKKSGVGLDWISVLEFSIIEDNLKYAFPRTQVRDISHITCMELEYKICDSLTWDHVGQLDAEEVPLMVGCV